MAASGTARTRIWNPDRIAADVGDLAAAERDSSVAARSDGPRPRPRTAPAKRSTRSVTGEGLHWSPSEKLEYAACLASLWSVAETLEQSCASDEPRPGRKRLHPLFEALLFAVAAKVCGGYRAADRTLSDPKLWQRLSAAVADAYPHDHRRRLAATPIRRHHFDWMRRRHLSEDAVDLWDAATTEAALAAVASMNGLNPATGSVTHPHPTQIGVGDGTWIPARYRASASDRDHAAADGTNLRFDPDAVSYHNDTAPGPLRGNMAVMFTWRSEHRQERVVIAAALKPPNQTDASCFVDMVLQTRSRHRDRTAGLRAVAYDMALSATDIDRLQDAGIVAVAKVPRTSRKLPSTANLGSHTFTHPATGHSADLCVHAVDGPPTIKTADSQGTIHHLRLTRHHLRHRSHPNRSTLYGTYSVPDHPLAPPDLIAARTLIRHNSTTQERRATPHQRRSRALRAISEADEDFDRLYGLREDSESNNSQYKATLNHGRARTVGAEHLRIDLLAYQTLTIITALVANHRRTRNTLKHWFGTRPPPYRGDPTD